MISFNWKSLRRRAAPSYPETDWSVAAEVEIEHHRGDRPSGHPWARFCLVNRHLEDRPALDLPRLHRDMAGADELAEGASVSRASGPRAEGQSHGGELWDGADGRTRMQRDWDFLQRHLSLALERYRAYSLPVMSVESYRREDHEMSAWRTVKALAHYAINWKSRIPEMAAAPHPVDVLVRSYHCTGAANVLFALCTVAGIPVRRISISHHSMVEALVDGRWVWLDNLVGGECVHPFSYQELITRLKEWPHLSGRQFQMLAGMVPFHRSPYCFDEALSWRFGVDVLNSGAGESGDVAQGTGLSLGYDPSTATALYPDLPEYLFACPASPEGRPILTLNPKQSWLHAPFRLCGDLALRARFTLSACPDNPVEAARLKVWCAPGVSPDALRPTLDGVPLGGGRVGRAREQMA